MRVLAGRYKGRSLYRPRNELIRPTTDKIKGYIFNYIGNAVQDAIILDLFSGTGNFAVEALSRGAKFSISVDSTQEAIRIIYRNLAQTDFLSHCQIVRRDVFKYLKTAIRKGLKFNLIFADPPYAMTDYGQLIAMIATGDLLSDNALFVLEHSSQTEIFLHEPLLKQEQTRIFGDSAVTIFSKIKGY